LNTSDPSGNSDYNFTSSGIAWPGEAKKYSATSGYTNNLDQVVPPPNWALRYPNGYPNASSIPNLQADEHFQNWMRTAGLPTFTKLYGRNDTAPLPAGQYQVLVYMSMVVVTAPLLVSDCCVSDYPVQGYKGTKSLVISTVSWIGGKNPFLGWAYVAASAVFVFLALAGTIRHLLKPRYGAFSCMRLWLNALQTFGRHVIAVLEPIEHVGYHEHSYVLEAGRFDHVISFHDLTLPHTIFYLFYELQWRGIADAVAAYNDET
jgi:hypothetical protein